MLTEEQWLEKGLIVLHLFFVAIALKLKRREPPLRNGCSLPLSSFSSTPALVGEKRGVESKTAVVPAPVRIVAIKQLKQDGYQGSNELLVEVLMLTVLWHPNLVNLIGYCAEGDERLLVYEYMCKGTLEDHLFDLTPDKTPIDWNTRMKIALGPTKGLTYLHDVANPPVIYRDMKEANVLLDENFNPKLCGHYKKLAPEYEKLGSSFKKDKSVLIGKVDCDEHKSICSKYGVSGYPTIQWFPKGSLEPKKVKQSSLHMMHNKYEQSCRYEGPRTAEALTEFVNTEGGVATASILLLYGVSGYPTLKFFPKENKAGEDYEVERELDDFVKFINEKCGTSRDANGQLTFQAGIVASLDALVKEFVSASNEEQKAILSRMEEEVGKLTGSSAR
ncbi:hypothetical protein ZIOFF_023773 [Zingiber officinale]|uniref:Protein kinase domain-containing protein n=1 Tax=Zingiber officinale TaxID=94328 RepID=A0A8J5GSI5_ZINOF|nr:hypothetical protein ZIOFF_023773 [Zingiber officinale]